MVNRPNTHQNHYYYVIYQCIIFPSRKTITTLQSRHIKITTIRLGMPKSDIPNHLALQISSR
ncbi:Uncharacterised protein [Vibrio cholerae]|nr:Uncharacterised protein [Vibrio cholerae]